MVPTNPPTQNGQYERVVQPRIKETKTKKETKKEKWIKISFFTIPL